eukprot:gene15703-biopygen8810
MFPDPGILLSSEGLVGLEVQGCSDTCAEHISNWMLKGGREWDRDFPVANAEADGEDQPASEQLAVRRRWAIRSARGGAAAAAAGLRVRGHDEFGLTYFGAVGVAPVEYSKESRKKLAKRRLGKTGAGRLKGKNWRGLSMPGAASEGGLKKTGEA